MVKKIKRVLVTGGSGYVGKHFLSSLKRDFPLLQIFVAQRSYFFALDNDISFQKVHIDLTQPIDIDIQVDTIFHVAGEKKDESKMWDINYSGTKRLLEWALQHGVKKFVYLSSVGVYGAGTNAGIVKENHERRPENIYEKSKKSAEDLVCKTCASSGIDYVIVQPSNVIGIVDRGAFHLLGLIRSVKKGYFTFFGKGSYFNYVSVEDVAAAIISTIRQEANNKTFIINTPITLSQAVDIIADQLNMIAPGRCLPKSFGFLAGEIASTLNGFLWKGLPFSRERYRELTSKTLYDGSYITQITGFSYPTGITAVLQHLVQFYLEKRLL